MIKKLISSLFNSKDNDERKALYQKAKIEANRILTEYPMPSIDTTSKFNYSYDPLSHMRDQISARIRYNQIWQEGFVQAIFDKLKGNGNFNQMDFRKVDSEFSLILWFYDPRLPQSSINAKLEKAIWKLGYASYGKYLSDGFMPF